MKLKQPVSEREEDRRQRQRREALEAPRLAWPLKEAAHRMGVSTALIYKMARASKIKLTKIAGRTVVLDAEINRLMAGESAGAA